MLNKISFLRDNYNCGGRGCPKSFKCGGGCVKKVQLWGILGELANINLIMGGSSIFNWGEYEEETSYN